MSLWYGWHSSVHQVWHFQTRMIHTFVQRRSLFTPCFDVLQTKKLVEIIQKPYTYMPWKITISNKNFDTLLFWTLKFITQTFNSQFALTLRRDFEIPSLKICLLYIFSASVQTVPPTHTTLRGLAMTPKW